MIINQGPVIRDTQVPLAFVSILKAFYLTSESLSDTQKWQVLVMDGLACLQKDALRVDDRDEIIQKMTCRFFPSEQGALQGKGLGNWYAYWKFQHPESFQSIPKVPQLSMTLIPSSKARIVFSCSIRRWPATSFQPC